MSEGKASKGSVVIQSYRGRLRMRLPRSVSREFFNIDQKYIALELDDTPENWAMAEKYRTMAEWDIKYDEFDPSCTKYKPHQISSSRSTDPIANKIEANHRKAMRRLAADEALLAPYKAKPLLPLWDEWVSTLDLSARTANVHYAYIRRMIEKAGESATTYNHDWFIKYVDPKGNSLSARTWNDRLTYLRAFGEWLRSKGYVQQLIYSELKNKKGEKKEIEPFTLEEMNRILSAFRNNEFCSRYSPVKHSHYADFVYFLFATGCRTSEAIGLQWKH